VLLTVLSALLIVAMRRADRRRRLLKMKGRRLESEKAGEYNRTTSMLVAVVLCFVVTELPQGVLAFLSGVDQSIFHNVYTPLGLTPKTSSLRYLAMAASKWRHLANE